MSLAHWLDRQAMLFLVLWHACILAIGGLLGVAWCVWRQGRRAR